jgi:LysM repeat protein
MTPLRERRLGRYLGPIVLVGVIVATVLVVQAGLSNSPRTDAANRQDRATPTAHPASRKVFYVVQAGDSLSAISVKAGVSLPALEALNPTVDPNSLPTGRRLRLRR